MLKRRGRGSIPRLGNLIFLIFWVGLNIWCDAKVSGADPEFFPREGPVGHSATKTPQRRAGVWGEGTEGGLGGGGDSPKKI